MPDGRPILDYFFNFDFFTRLRADDFIDSLPHPELPQQRGDFFRAIASSP